MASYLNFWIFLGAIFLNPFRLSKMPEIFNIYKKKSLLSEY
jgi:hypothetical protein